jgi:hypothetical protein
MAKRALPTQLNTKLLVALALVLAYHGGLLLAGTYQGTYDAYVHIFFADHYRRAWFDHWDTRWYTGFTLTSYPPGSQQAVALLSYLIGLQSAFVCVQTFAILWVVVGVYRFSRLWVSDDAAGNAALLAVFASGINETVHVFGQLPTMFSLGFLLNALPYIYRWLRYGELRILLVAWALNAATTAGHHVSTLFGAIFFVAPVIMLALVEALRTPCADEPAGRPAQITRANLWPLLARRLRRMLPTLIRSGVYGIGLVAALVVVVLPYWLWSRNDPITQMAIPHASRDSFLENLNAGLIFWVVPYGLTILAFPYVFAKGFGSKAWPLASSLALLMLLGTGGTTPIPRFLLRGAFDVLTLDRFTFWATIVMLPLLGAWVVSMRRGRLARIMKDQLGVSPWYAIQGGLVIAYLVIAIFVANLTQFRRFQPQAIDMQPIVSFIAKDEHWRWRYLTLGFGDQMAWLSAQTTANSVDGNYHSARRLPELTTTPVERLEGAKFRGIPGLGSLQQFLAIPEKYHLKFVFSNDQFYDPLLYFSGWHRLQRLENGIVVWEREDVPALPAVLPRKEIPLWQRAMWGIVPMAALISGMLLMAASAMRDRRQPPDAMGRTSNQLWQRMLRRPDAWLRTQSHLPAGDGAEQHRWQPWRSWAAPLWMRQPLAANLRIRMLRTGLLVVIGMALGGFGTYSLVQRWLGPQALIEQYYDDLDFRRFDAAYARLDPQTRPAYDQFLLNRSVQGGLVISYGKLDAVHANVVQIGATRAHATVQAIWVTALAEYAIQEEYDMVVRDGRWYLIVPSTNTAVPPDSFFRQPGVNWYAQGRRQPRIGPTDPADVLDRPGLQVLSARLVRVGGRYQVVGEVLNTDTSPADVTVTTALFDTQKVELTRYNAQSVMLHKLLPKEITPFRVDFEGVAGAILTEAYQADEFRPGAFTPPNLLNPVGSFLVLPKAVVTGRDLDRLLSVQQLRVVQANDGSWEITGRLFNSGSAEATIPHVLLALYDAAGNVAWVEEFYLAESIRPQRSVPLRLAIRPASSVEPLLLNPGRPAGLQHPDAFVLPGATGYAAARVLVHSYHVGETD